MTEDVAFTPGPWAVCTDPPNKTWLAGITVYSPAEGRRVGDSCFLDSRAEANARLIAAAPEMYEALTAALSFIDDGIESPGPTEAEHSVEARRLVEKIRAALSKATGALPQTEVAR